MAKNNVLDELASIDTPTITNVVATYPSHPLCLDLYDSWFGKWHTDQSIRCMFPELGPRVGYAVTCVFGMPDRSRSQFTVTDIMEALINSRQPTIFVYQQDFAAGVLETSGLLGELMMTAMKAVGCVGAISNGPSRDIAEVKKLGFQLLLSGAVAGHGDIGIYGINRPVTVGGMDVSPGDIVHMDVNGACKFPAERADEVLTNALALQEEERAVLSALRSAKSPQEVITALVSKAQYGDYHRKMPSGNAAVIPKGSQGTLYTPRKKDE